MKNLLTRGGIEIIAVFIGISGGLWSEKQSELNKIIKSEDHNIIKSEGIAAPSIKSLEAILNAFVENVSKLNGRNISVIGSSFIISIEINMNAKAKFFFSIGK